jgi:hypothetical protein
MLADTGTRGSDGLLFLRLSDGSDGSLSSTESSKAGSPPSSIDDLNGSSSSFVVL